MERTSSSFEALATLTANSCNSSASKNLLIAPSSPASEFKKTVSLNLSNALLAVPSGLSAPAPLPTRIRVAQSFPFTMSKGLRPRAKKNIESSIALRIAKRGPARVKNDQVDVIWSIMFLCDTPIILAAIP